ncbi:HupE/UreJ family protein [Corallococcus sp. H22C18031201]|uniref:HupE/UreJ family protein n=1 Tax=Citreicoccus inhibens TaxID=2849499 RepID=UPI000E72C168|nr:HupE/UreJ family protein [Citreicoccus inhibens]MBU8897409.1 HupE/UreJ family protein [Citreicoccus inhibens]RJS16811.1 HupE/UreJ family protein [Corallococcus sp. H22C18031201]
MRNLCLGMVVLAALWGSLARAHDADILYAQARREGPDASRVQETVTLTANTLALLVPVDAHGSLTQAELNARADALSVGVWDAMPMTAGGKACVRSGQRAWLRDAYVELSATFECPPGPLRQTFRLLAVLPANYRVVVGSFLEGDGPGALFADAAQPSVMLPGPGESASRVSGLGGWISLGIHHIFSGVDHLAFLLAVLLVGGSFRRVLLLVTSFTVAHSLTLGATALGFVVLDGARARWVEAAIAASIIYVAVENLVLRRHEHRALVTFLFGLVHGFGFASALREQGLGQDVVSGLLGFNLGVEVGQAVVVAVLLPVLRMVQRRPTLHRRTVRFLSLGILVAGGYWMVQRALG